jgi:hypothetical protein
VNATEKERLKRLQQAFEAERSQFERTWAEIARLCLPSQENWFGEPPAEGPDPRIYTTVGLEGLRRCAAALASVLAPDGERFHDLVIDGDPEREREVAERALRALEVLRDQGGFQAAIQTALQGMVAFGHGCVEVRDVPGRGLAYRAIPSQEVWFAENELGRVDRVHRRYRLTGWQALEAFGDDLPPRVREQAERNPGVELSFLHCVYPREKGPGYDSVHLLADSYEEVQEGTYRTLPYVIARFQAVPGTVYGRGPAWYALTALRALNVMRRNALIADNLRARPVLATAATIVPPPALRPGAIHRGWLSPEGRPLVAPLDLGTRADVSQLEEALILEVNAAFMTSLFLDAALDEPGHRTATEVQVRVRERAMLLGPIVARLQRELLAPIVQRELDILEHEGGLAEILPEGVERLDLEFVGPGWRLQGQVQAQGIERTIAVLQPLVAADPGLAQLVDWQAAARLVARANGVPADVLRSQADLARLQQQAAARIVQQLGAAVGGGQAAAPEPVGAMLQ